MDTALGLLGLIGFILCVLALSSGTTWLVVKLTPAPSTKSKASTPEPEAGS